MGPHEKGTIAQQHVLAELTERRYAVATPVRDWERWDAIVVDRDGTLLRAQIKNGVVRDGCLRFSTSSSTYHRPDGEGAKDYREDADIFLVWEGASRKVYWVPVADVPTRAGSLRVDPRKVDGDSRWAAPYELDRRDHTSEDWSPPLKQATPSSSDEWEEFYELTRQFAEREGHASIPQRHRENGVRLGRWVNRQRTIYARGQLDDDRVARLESLPGWKWSDAKGQDWDSAYAAILAFAEREGHTSPQRTHNEGDVLRLGEWCEVQRRAHKRGTIPKERSDKLERVPGWFWERPGEQERWQLFYTQLQEYVAAHQSLPPERLPGPDRRSFPLGKWVSRQRRLNRDGLLLSERVHTLEQVPHWHW